MIAAVMPKPACGEKHGRFHKADREPFIHNTLQTQGRESPSLGPRTFWSPILLLASTELCIITVG